jgi:poly(A) polymerase
MLCLKEMESLLGNPGEEFGDAGDFRDYLTDALVRGRSRAALLKLAVLLHDAGKPGKASRDVEGQSHFYGHAAAGEVIAEAVSERLRLAKAERDYLKLLVVNHMHLVHLTAGTSRTRRSVLHFFRKYGEDYRALLLLFEADTRATAGPKMTPERVRLIRDAVTEMLRLYEEDLRPRMQAPPLLTGGDLIDRFGLEPGPLIGEILRKVEDARLEGLVLDRHSAMEVAAALLRDRG